MNGCKDYFHSRKIMIVASILLFLLVFISLWTRIKYGVEISDEAFYVAEAYLVTQGAIPYVTNWTPIGAQALYAPLVWLFIKINGSTEGIYLFMRQSFVVYKLCICASIIFILRKHIKPEIMALCVLPYFALSVVSLESFSYNTICISFLLLAMSLLFAGFQATDKREAIIYTSLSGGITALNVFAHAAVWMIVPFIIVTLFVLEKSRYGSWFRTKHLIISGLLMGGMIFLFLLLAGGGVDNIINGIKYILNRLGQPKGNAGLVAYADLIATKSAWFLESFPPIFLGVFSVTYIFNYLCYKIFYGIQHKISSVYAVSLFISQIIYFYFLFDYYFPAYKLELSLNICFMYMLIMLLLLPTAKNIDRVYWNLFFIVVMPFILLYLTYLFNLRGVSGRDYVLYPGVMMLILLNHHILKEVISNKYSAVFYAGGTILLSSLFAVAFQLSFWGYVYRDAPLEKLTYCMDKGIFKGLYTLEKRGKALIFLEEEIRGHTVTEDRILVMTQAPEVYLMTAAKPFTPSTWDRTGYSYGLKDDFLLQEYFKVMGASPNKIIYVHDKERDKILSLNDEKYLFNKYLNQYYYLTYSNNEEDFPIFVYEKK